VPWGPRLYAWALALVALAVVATLLPLLRAFGPGRTYMRAAVFPTAYVLAFGIGTPQGLLRPVGLATLESMALSLGAIGFFYAYTRSRDRDDSDGA
jgi:peptidoglycan biosynthesis protein MviN/MurJ (putative lipid II flippase)